MDIFSTLLSGPALTVLSVGVTLGLAIRAFAGLAKEMPDLRIRYDQVQSQLDAELTGIPAFKETIKEMQETLTPNKRLVQQLQDYYTALMEIERKNTMAEQEKNDADEIQMHRPGGH